MFNSLKIFRLVYDNDVDIFYPEFWANTGLAVLEESLVLGNLVHRDFEPLIQQAGSTINIAVPGTFKAHRKTDDEQVRLQDATASTKSLVLDQHWHTSFIIKDGEESKSYVDLVELYIRPAVVSIAEAIDLVIAGQYVRFLNNLSGHLGGLSSSTAKEYILAARTAMNIARVPSQERIALLTHEAEGEILALDRFLDANTRGDDGSALRDASLGRTLGFDFFTSPNIAQVASTHTTTATTTTAIHAKGATTIAVTSSAGAAVGTWFTIAGDDTPLQVVTVPNGTSVTTYIGTRRATASGAAVTWYTPGAVNQPNSLTSRGITVSDGYPAGWHKEIAIDGSAVDPEVGQAVTFGSNNASVYCVISYDSTLGIELDRPLEFAIADNATVNTAPAGSYNLIFNKNAIALVTRPLAMPRANTGAQSFVANLNGLSMRAVLTYQGMDQGTLVTMDMLGGVTVLESYLGHVMLG
jgi:hypothetical protein